MSSAGTGPERDEASAAKGRLVRLYDEIAATYGTALDMFDVFARALVAATHLQRGDRVLDVGCGLGACLRPALEAVGEAGFVLGIDLSPAMVAQLSQELQRDRVSNAEVQVGDAEHMDFPGGSYDAVTYGFAIHHSPNLLRAL